MKKSIVSTVLVSVLGLMGITAPASGQTDFTQWTSIAVNSDMNSGYAYGTGYGRNAVVTSIVSESDYYMPRDGEIIYITTFIRMDGVWGDPMDDNNPYYRFLEDNGLNTSNTTEFNRITFDGQNYDFTRPVSVTTNSTGMLRRYSDTGSMFGDLHSWVTSQGAIPVSSWGEVRIWEVGHPEYYPDWTLQFGFTHLVTEDFTVPTPGSLALGGISLLVLARRRR